MGTDALVPRLVAALGASLDAVVLFGSAAGSEHHQAHSDMNVLVLLSRFGPGELTPAFAAVTRDWAAAGQPTPLVMTSAEFHRSTDIFPIELGDILARHRVLHGEVSFAGMQVAAANLRLQLEQEAMGKLLKLRSAILAADGDADRQRALLVKSFSTFMVLFRALERLVGAPPTDGYDELVGSVAVRVGFDAAPWLAVARHRRGAGPLDGPAALLPGYLAGAEKLAAFLDVYPTGA